ncbi:TIGR02680 family protein [Bacillus sp. P14.5]|uniref:TIGR02680 family protein n=1 Tax=Bacillus sp. P14.5 TaxID=1983400 RepID=UPI000DEA60F2|nr:TIGR02680 family protein [Bacillus sp. P14.5]
MTDTQWMMNKAGLLNFWYYDEEIFKFSEGKLLLRGTNGSGKSVTMQSFLPVLLDGKKSPDRLDPFGSKARKMEDYLLGEKEVVNRDERTGYLFIEYKKRGTDQYVTTGIGMQAKRNKGIKSWYFLLTDNRRIGKDFHLSQVHLGDRVPFSAKELENRIGDGGYVVHTQREYMYLVNKHVFGFQSVEAYEDLIKLLIQLRSPKLSKDFKPTVIYEILESALPPLTDDELRHLSDTIENMDQTQQQLEQLEREFDSSQKLTAQYHLYNQYILAERAKQWQVSQDRHGKGQEKTQALEKEVEELSSEILRLEEDQKLALQKRDLAESEKGRLQKHEVWKLEEDKASMKEELSRLTKSLRDLQEKWDKKKAKLNDDWKQREMNETDLSRQEQTVEDLLDELEVDGEEAAFSQHAVNAADFQRHSREEFDFTVWSKEAEQHEGLLSSLGKLAEKLDSLSTNYDRLQQESSEKKQEIDALQKEQDHLSQWFTEQKATLQNDVFSWIGRHSKLCYSEEHQQEMARSLQGLYEANRYDDIREMLLSGINDYSAEVKAEMSMARQRQSEKKQEIAEADNQLHYWKNLKMPNPDRHGDTEEYRQMLREKGVPFLPFYAAVEFQDHVTEEQKERLESALMHAGLLDSLITEEKTDLVHDRFIRAEPLVLGHTLADYLYPDVDESNGIPGALVDEVLRSISLDEQENGFRIDLDGSYSTGCLEGHAPEEGPSKYIGRTSQKRYKLQKISEWEENLAVLKGELQQWERTVLNCEEALKEAEDWKTTIPSDKELSDLHQSIETNQRAISQEKQQLLKLESRWKEILQEMQKTKLELHGQGSSLNLKLDLETLAGALEASRSYRTYLHKLDKVSQRCFFISQQIETLSSLMELAEEELDEIRGDQNVSESRLSAIEAEIQSIEEQMKLKGIDDIRKRISEVIDELRTAGDQISELYEVLPQKRAARHTLLKELESARINASFWLNMSLEWGSIVKKELSRGFIEGEASDPSGVLSELGAVLEKHDRAKLSEQLTKTFLNEQQNLMEYRMFEYSEEEERPDWFSEDFGEYYEPFKNEWEQLRGRRLVQMEYQGQRVSPYFVRSSLEKELESQRGWLDEQDRQLYQDIMVNTVGVILRNRIQRAQKWVKEMNAIMESRDNSSGLLFSVAWKPLTAESEQELDTSDLVKLLQRNSKFLNEEDLNRITKHFQSRIEKAKELIQLRNEGSTLHQVLKEVLDYRKWFTFVLSFRRVNEPKRELTNNAFFKFSGGEKAMAMYIPLFTAAYSRYKEAGEMAPYIISLDEAFAGVDEQNIRDMFEVVEQLGFNYIMNSQALWGDYDTISSLSISELVRPKNADFVTVIRYEWDGNQRNLVIEEETKEDEEVLIN